MALEVVNHNLSGKYNTKKEVSITETSFFTHKNVSDLKVYYSVIGVPL